MNESFPKCDRIRKRTEYLAVQGSGRKLHSDNFMLFYLSQSEARPARFGFTVSKKVGGAVARNHVRRLVREVCRRHRSWFPTGAKLVFVAKRGATGLDYRRTEREIEALCARHFPK
jgi:ribonuclease P protein component